MRMGRLTRQPRRQATQAEFRGVPNDSPLRPTLDVQSLNGIGMILKNSSKGNRRDSATYNDLGTS